MGNGISGFKDFLINGKTMKIANLFPESHVWLFIRKMRAVYTR